MKKIAGFFLFAALFLLFSLYLFVEPVTAQGSVCSFDRLPLETMNEGEQLSFYVHNNLDHDQAFYIRVDPSGTSQRKDYPITIGAGQNSELLTPPIRTQGSFFEYTPDKVYIWVWIGEEAGEESAEGTVCHRILRVLTSDDIEAERADCDITAPAIYPNETPQFTITNKTDDKVWFGVKDHRSRIHMRPAPFAKGETKSNIASIQGRDLDLGDYYLAVYLTDGPPGQDPITHAYPDYVRREDMLGEICFTLLKVTRDSEEHGRIFSTEDYSGGIPGVTVTFCKDGAGIQTALGCIPINDANQFVAWLMKRAIGIGGGIAFLLMIFAGFQIITSSGDPKKLQAGKEMLGSAIAGLILIIFSIFLLQLIGVKILQIPGFGK